MTGIVDSAGRALLAIEIRHATAQANQSLNVWIDTGFTGDLVIPKVLIQRLGLAKSGSLDAMLADGSTTVLDTYSCRINWLGQDRPLEVIANDGQFPLLGVGLLLGQELRVNYSTQSLSLLPATAV